MLHRLNLWVRARLSGSVSEVLGREIQRPAVRRISQAGSRDTACIRNLFAASRVELNDLSLLYGEPVLIVLRDALHYLTQGLAQAAASGSVPRAYLAQLAARLSAASGTSRQRPGGLPR